MSWGSLLVQLSECLYLRSFRETAPILVEPGGSDADVDAELPSELDC